MIVGDQVRFRAIEKDDLPSFVHWLNDPEVKGGLSVLYPISLAEEEEWFKDMLKKAPRERPMAIEIQPDPGEDRWVFVGNCGFINIDLENRSGEIGIHIGEKDYWNQGYGTKTIQLLLNHGFNNINLHRIFLRVFESNQRAVRTYEKAGLILEGKMREAQYIDGSYEDVLLMSVLRHEWQNGN
jgi:RimJ/RimL family protein N-acetyltransferase